MAECTVGADRSQNESPSIEFHPYRQEKERGQRNQRKRKNEEDAGLNPAKGSEDQRTDCVPYGVIPRLPVLHRSRSQLKENWTMPAIVTRVPAANLGKIGILNSFS